MLHCLGPEQSGAVKPREDPDGNRPSAEPAQPKGADQDDGIMKGILVAGLSAVVLVGTFPAASFAQAPAPKVTINGMIDFVATAYKNLSYLAAQAGGTPGQPDVTDSNDKGWSSRERAQFTLTGEVGRVKGVWAIELDFTNGAGNFNNSSNSGSLTTVGFAGGLSANLDLDTDIQDVLETKWLYLEAPVTGPGSLLPFIPVKTTARIGAQPFRGHEYRFGILASGDFSGVNLVTEWTPDIRSTVTFVQIGEALDRFTAANQKDSIALLASVEMDVFKGLALKPTYAYAFYDGGNCGTSNLGTAAYGGYNPNTNCPGVTAGSLAAPGNVGRNITRHYLGGAGRWTMGAVTLESTFFYLLGRQEVLSRSRVLNDVDVRSLIVDSVGSFRTGPFIIESRIMYTPGVDAHHDVQNGGGGVIRTYQPINSGFAYMVFWSEIWSLGVDYTANLLGARSGLTLRESPSYDKYGRLFVLLRADYAATPALTLRLSTSFSWTDTKVDTRGTFSAGILPSGITTPGNPFDGGKERYLGSEWIARLTYRFADNVVFDLGGAALISGPALGINGRDPKNVYKLSSRLRVTF